MEYHKFLVASGESHTRVDGLLVSVSDSDGSDKEGSMHRYL